MSTNEKSYQNKQVLQLLDSIYQLEVAGINQYLHFSFMIMGYNRIPIQKWFRDNASESMAHATLLGEKITSLGGHPTLVAPKVVENNDHSILQLLNESLKHEEQAVALYKELTAVATELGDIALEEMARDFVRSEVEHVDEVRKMIRTPEGK
ncbi:MAG: ferritin-like domain-containing protein [Bdellovibrionales bacterium]|nr:ferritin-like domain-containing protein [Bdellovibrionales bacterium]